ncbi:MAG: DUF4336 domain-containing protein [Myxococcota bacterium]
MLREAGRDLWLADGPPVRFLRIDYPTRMAVVRLANGGLWLWSPIEWNESLGAAVDALGPVEHLVAPNKIHHLLLPGWVSRHPAAKLHAAPGLARKRPDLHFDTELGDAPDPAWAGQIDQVVFRGSLALEEVAFFHRASRTALFCDLIQRFDAATLGGWRLWLMRADGLVGPDGSTPREWRASFLRRGPARRALATALDWNAERLVIAHGALPQENGRAAIARGLRWLAPAER